MDRRAVLRNLGELGAALLVFVAFMWAVWEALLTAVVVSAEASPCSTQPNKALLVLIALAIATAALAAVVLLYRGRPLAAFVGASIQLPLVFAWAAIDGGAAGCIWG
jgi:hypothetical protein